MSFMELSLTPDVPLMSTHTSYPGSWTWQAAADEPVGNPQAYYMGPGYTGSPYGIGGLGSVPEADREALEGAVEAIESMARNPGISRSQFSAVASPVREQLAREGFPSWGGFLGFGKHPSSRELLDRINVAHNLKIAQRPDDTGYVAPGKGVIDPETGRAREDSAVSTFITELPGEIKKQAEKIAPKWAMGGLGLIALALAGVYVYSYVQAKGARRGGR